MGCILVTCVLCVGYCCHMCIDVSTFDAGLLARCQCSEGPATGHLDSRFFFLGFPVSLKQIAEMVPKHSKLPLHASHVSLPMES